MMIISRHRTIVAWVVAALAAVGYADMVPPVAWDVAAHVQTCSETTTADSYFCELNFGVDLAWASDFTWPVVVFAPPVAQAEPADKDGAVVVLTDRQGGLTLCLYGLIGFGLCKSGIWGRRFSFGTIPEWYHSGAPQQIGHSYAVGPNAYYPVDVCFVQADAPRQNLSPQYACGTVICLWRHSQTTPTTLGGRAPPGVS